MVLIGKAMKRIDTILLATIALTVASCAEKNQISASQETQNDGLVEMTLKAVVDDQVVDTKTTYSGKNIFWEEEDAITVFFEGDEIVKSTFTESLLFDDNRQASFTGLGDESANAYLAVYPASEGYTYYDKDLTVTIPSEQVAVVNSFASGANVSVAYSSDTALKFRNVGSLIAFRFETAEDAARTASVTFRAKTATEGEYLGITGAATVNIQEQQPAADSEDPVTYIPVVTGNGDGDYVKLIAPEGGFESGTNKVYYAVIYPGNYENGFEVTFTTKDEPSQTFELNNDEAVTLTRNSLLSMGAIPNPYDTLPAEITISLDFTKDVCPLGTFPKVANQKENGDTFPYQYEYEWNGVSETETFEFLITKGTSRSSTTTPLPTGYYQHINDGGKYQNKQLYVVCNSGDTKIKLPAIRGRYLKSVSMGVQNTDNRRFRLQNQAMNRYVSSSWVKATSTNTADKATTTISFPSTSETFPTTTMGVGYIIQLTDKANYNITDITLVYTKKAPVAETTEPIE